MVTSDNRGDPADLRRPLALERLLPPIWRADLLSRDRLLARLEASVGSHRLTAVCAPAGYGKTTLLADFARQARWRLGWLRLEPADRDPAHLLAVLSEAVDLRASLDRASTRERGPGAAAWVAGRPPSVVELANRMAWVPEDTVLVLDDFQMIADSHLAVRTVRELARRLPAHVRLVVASRHALPPALADAASSGAADHLDGESLRFDLHDIEGLFERWSVPVETWPALTRAIGPCEGWPAAVVLAVRRHTRGADGRAWRADDPKDVYDALVSGLIEQLDEPYRRFLHEIANLDRISPELCGACLQAEGAPGMLGHLAAMNLFLEQQPTHDTYRMHGLLRRYLTVDSPDRRAFTPEQHEAAAAWFHQAGEPVREIRHLIAAGARGAALARLETEAPDLAKRARWHTLLELVEALAAAGPVPQPLPAWLVRLEARAQIAVGDSRGAIASVSGAIEHDNVDQSDLVALHVTRSYAHQCRGEFVAAIEDAKTAFGYAELLTPDLQVKVLRLLGQTHASNLELDAAGGHFSEASRLAERHDLHRSRAMVLLDVAVYETIRGRLDRAVEVANDAVLLSEALDYISAQLFALNNLASGLHLRGEYTLALETLERVLSLAREHDQRRVETLSWLGRGDVYLDLLMSDAAHTCYTRGLSLAHELDEADLLAHARRALAAHQRSEGDLAASRRLLDDSNGLGPRRDRYTRALDRIEDGALSIAEGNLDLATRQLERVVATLEGAGARVDHARARLYLAHARFLDRGVAAALPELEALAGIVGEMGEHQFLVPRAERMPRLWGAVEAAGHGALRAALTQPDLRPRVKPEHRGLPASARFGDPHPALLTAREREIVIALCEGLSREEIGDRMGLSRSTIHKAISALYASTGFARAYQLVAWGHRSGLYDPLNPPPPQTT